ncbi:MULTISPECIES: helix-turn-helix transcriptional regulator [unclassified Sutcliffiella]|uniref:helix-turn-helix domain-containing protein n=1 Tax=unclassified Sutcliffiella TaxID=2837532 RepID=UPI0030CC20D1
MVVGGIIRFYRERAGLTQSQLGEGICTTNHVSKIERGKTAYSDEIISLLSERLNINIREELAYLQEVKRLLQEWHNALILRRKTKIEELRDKLGKSEVVQASKYAARYHLLMARYYLHHNKLEEAEALIKKVEKEYIDKMPFDCNLYLHIKGIYYLGSSNNEDHQKAISVLNQINLKEYGNKEYYYHLATAYFLIDSKVLSYHYIEKALKYFKNSNNFFQANRAEAMMLLQLSSDIYSDFDFIVDRYNNLITNCEQYGLIENKGLLLNNLGYEYYNRKLYDVALHYFKEALSLAEEKSNSYLIRLYNYIDCSIEGNFGKKRFLLRKIKEGLEDANLSNNSLHKTLFMLLKYRMEANYEAYYLFMETVALPQFYSGKHVALMKRYGKVLFTHYIENKNHEKAAKMSTYI